MKKVRVSLKRGKKEWRLRLFDSAESAYYLKENEESDPFKEYHQDIVLTRGTKMEIEWMGSEYLYDDEDASKTHPTSMRHEKFMRVRLGKYAGNTVDVGDAIELGVGWILGNEIPWGGGDQNGVRVIPVNSKSKSIIDLDELFCEIPGLESDVSHENKEISQEKINMN